MDFIQFQINLSLLNVVFFGVMYQGKDVFW